MFFPINFSLSHLVSLCLTLSHLVSPCLLLSPLVSTPLTGTNLPCFLHLSNLVYPFFPSRNPFNSFPLDEDFKYSELGSPNFVPITPLSPSLPFDELYEENPLNASFSLTPYLKRVQGIFSWSRKIQSKNKNSLISSYYDHHFWESTSETYNDSEPIKLFAPNVPGPDIDRLKGLLIGEVYFPPPLPKKHISYGSIGMEKRL